MSKATMQHHSSGLTGNLEALRRRFDGAPMMTRRECDEAFDAIIEHAEEAMAGAKRKFQIALGLMVMIVALGALGSGLLAEYHAQRMSEFRADADYKLKNAKAAFADSQQIAQDRFDQINDLQTQLRATTAQARAARHQAANFRNMLADTEDECAELQTRIDSQQEQLAEADTRRNELEHRLAGAESDLVSMQKQVATAQSQLTTAEARLSDALVLNESLCDELDLRDRVAPTPHRSNALAMNLFDMLTQIGRSYARPRANQHPAATSPEPHKQVRVASSITTTSNNAPTVTAAAPSVLSMPAAEAPDATYGPVPTSEAQLSVAPAAFPTRLADIWSPTSAPQPVDDSSPQSTEAPEDEMSLMPEPDDQPGIVYDVFDLPVEDNH